MNKHLDNESLPTWREAVAGGARTPLEDRGPFVVGVLEGEGVGPEVMQAALDVLSALESVTDRSFALERGERSRTELGGASGEGTPVASTVSAATSLAVPSRALRCCERVFAAGGAVLAGPHGGRFVYDLRARFDLFCKLIPVRPLRELVDAGRLREEFVTGVDCLLVRENVSGLYFGKHTETSTETEGLRVDYTFSYTEKTVRRILMAAARLARTRKGRLTVVTKDCGLPGLDRLWRESAGEVASATGIEASIVNVDYAAYALIQHAHELDVVVSSNLFGDILGDVSAVLLGSRGLSFSGNFSSSSAAVYQTCHGAAHDLAGRDGANPLAQILSLAMMLRESFGLVEEAALVEGAVRTVLRQGWRTRDILEGHGSLAGTKAMAGRVADAVVALSKSSSRRGV